MMCSFIWHSLFTTSMLALQHDVTGDGRYTPKKYNTMLSPLTITLVLTICIKFLYSFIYPQIPKYGMLT